jgi:hypothetical protein
MGAAHAIPREYFPDERESTPGHGGANREIEVFGCH